jgi:chondroitin AC lyase
MFHARRMRTAIVLFIVSFVLHFTAAISHAADHDLQLVSQNLRQSVLESGLGFWAQVKGPEMWLARMQADGSWTDQDYSDTDRIHWKAIDHLPRVLSILKAYYRSGTPLSGKPGVVNKCVTSLRFWLTKDPHNTNWWHNEIGVPQQVGEILMLLGDAAPADVRQAGAELMKRAKWEKQTGANLTDETRIQVMRGCITGSSELVSQGYERTWREVRLAGADEDGMQVDHSFHQHGPLLYCKGYGTVFVDDIIEFVDYARGTSYQMPADKRELLDAYLLGGPDWMLRGGRWDFGACGRGIVRDNLLRGSNLSELQPMAEFPDPLQSELQSAVVRLKALDDKSAPIGNRQYWLSDYMAHRRANYFASARMYSSRTLNTDGLTNGENKKSHHIADGATCFMVNGDEYFNIFPVWDWMRIPGTTVEQNVPMEPKEVSHKGKSEFVGEVSNGTYGCSVMELINHDVQAQKAWFCFDDEMVCLGTGINCKSANTVNTTINQCLLHGQVISSTDADSKKMRWVWHDSIGYIFPASTVVHEKHETQTGTWADIGSGSDKPVSADVFSLWIDHGSHVQDGQYEYIVMPGTDANHTARESQNLPIQVIQNTPALQAVFHNNLNLLEAAFHQPGQLSVDGMTLMVDQPCLLLMKKDGAKLELSVSNPLNKPATINVKLSQSVHGDGATSKDKGSNVKLQLPDGLMAGSSVVRQFTLDH